MPSRLSDSYQVKQRNQQTFVCKLLTSCVFTLCCPVSSVFVPVSLISYTEQYVEYDPFVTAPEPSNPWTSDDPSLWDLEARYETRNQSRFTLGAGERFLSASCAGTVKPV